MDTLNDKLQAVITRLSESARMSKIISINAAILADGRAGERAQTSAAIKVVAGEIQRLSTASSEGIEELNAILGEIRLLSQTINLAGRQRMISQKVMKLFLIRRAGVELPAGEELATWAEEFERALVRLQACGLNTPEIARQLERVGECWQQFRGALAKGDTPAAAELNERVLTAMHKAVQHYEALAGGNAAVA